MKEPFLELYCEVGLWFISRVVLFFAGLGDFAWGPTFFIAQGWRIFFCPFFRVWHLFYLCDRRLIIVIGVWHALLNAQWSQGRKLVWKLFGKIEAISLKRNEMTKLLCWKWDSFVHWSKVFFCWKYFWQFYLSVFSTLVGIRIQFVMPSWRKTFSTEIGDMLHCCWGSKKYGGCQVFFFSPRLDIKRMGK